MILPAIDPERFCDLVREAPLIAFQGLAYGFAIATEDEAYYAPIGHPGGGNLPSEPLASRGSFIDRLGYAFIRRMTTPRLRTLRPTATPIPTEALRRYLQSAFTDSPDFSEAFKKAPGDHSTVVEYQCQVVILAIEEHARPELKDELIVAKRDMMSDAIDVIIQHVESARDLAETGDWDPFRLRFHLLQCSTALQSALKGLLTP
jgi:hypothetical protein